MSTTVKLVAERSCIQCGERFQQKRKEQECCSRRCMYAMRVARNEAPPDATCAACERPFRMMNKNQRDKSARGGSVFCSRACGAKPYLADKAGWYVVHVAKTVGFMPYVDRPYASEEEARGIIRDLMKGYPADSEWWDLLSVRWLDAKCSKKAAA